MAFDAGRSSVCQNTAALNLGADVDALSRVLREVSASGELTVLEAEGGHWEVRAVRGGAVAVWQTPARPESGWHRYAFEALAHPAYLIGPHGRVLSVNPEAAASRAATVLGDLAGGPTAKLLLKDGHVRAMAGERVEVPAGPGEALVLSPLASTGLVLVEVVVPGATMVEEVGMGPEAPASHILRTHLNVLVGHLELLRDTPLSRSQQARLDCALDLVGELVEPEAPDMGGRIRPAQGIAVSEEGAVLVVDDDELNLSVTLSMLRALGVECQGASSAEEALCIMEATSFGLVFLDVMMPDCDGIEATLRIRDRFGSAPRVVGLTALPSAREACMNAGMDGFLTKPVRLQHIAETLQRFSVQPQA